jgi:hypothetical protein
MDEPESRVQSFIVKLWLEESGQETGRVVWRGYITHVPGGERRYLKKLSDIKDFIGHYLGEADVKSGAGHQLRAWLSRRTKRF